MSFIKELSNGSLLSSAVVAVVVVVVVCFIDILTNQRPVTGLLVKLTPFNWRTVFKVPEISVLKCKPSVRKGCIDFRAFIRRVIALSAVSNNHCFNYLQFSCL